MFSLDAKNSLFLTAVVYLMFVFAAPASAVVRETSTFTYAFTTATVVNGRNPGGINHGWRGMIRSVPFAMAAGTALGWAVLGTSGLMAGAGAIVAGAGEIVAGAGQLVTGAAVLAVPVAVVYIGAKIISKLEGAHALQISSPASVIDYLFILPANEQHASIKELIDSQQGKPPVKDKMPDDLIRLASIHNLFSLDKDYQLSTYDMDEKPLSIAFVIDRDHKAKNNSETGEIKGKDIERILEGRTFNYDLSSLSHYVYEKNMYEFITDTVNSFSMGLDKNLAGGLIYIALKKRSAWVAIVPYS